MRLAALALCVALGGCSFIGARVPHHPPPPEHCPEGVIVLDILGTAATLLPTILGTVALIQNDSQAAVLAAAITPPAAILALAYISSTVYGFAARSRCDRMKAEAQDAPETAPPAARAPPRAKVVGDKPLHCAITDPDVGECFFDEAACSSAAAAAAVACEDRTAGWCFDRRSIAGVRTETLCAASPIDCEARRVMFARDRTLVVSSCGPYVVGKTSVVP